MKFQSFLFALLWLALLSVPIRAQTQTDIRPLSVGQPIERELKGDEAHSYSIVVTSGQFLHVIVDQRGIDVVVTLFGADGKKLVEIDSPNGTQGPEPISMIVETTGNYRLEIRSLEKDASVGRYEAKIVELRAVTEKDKNQIAAQKAFAEGEALQSQGIAESLRGANKKYKEALVLYRLIGDKSREAVTLNNIGVVYVSLDEQQQALKFFNESLPLFRAVANKGGEAYTLNNIGKAYDDLGEKQQALKFYNEALSLHRTVGEKFGEAQTLNNIGGVYSALGEQQQALRVFNDSLTLIRAVGDKHGEAVTLNNIGKAYDDLGEKQQSLKFYNESLSVRRAIGDKRGEAVTLNNIGLVYSALRDQQQALKFYNEALPLRRAIGDKGGEAYTLSNIGLVFFSLGEQQQALKFYNEALSLFRAVGDKFGEAVTLNNIGAVYSALGEKQQALKFYNEALLLRRAVGDKFGEAQTLNNLFSDWQAVGNPRFGVFYGKQSVNNYQVLRSNVRGLDKDVQQTFLKSVEGAYRGLADALLAQGRFAEAQQVLNAFKDQQFFDFDQAQQKQLKPLTRTSREEDFALRHEKTNDALGEIGGKISELKRKLGNRKPNDEEAKQLQQLEAELKTASDEFSAVLKQAETDFSQPLSDKDKVGEIPDTKEMQTALRNLQSQTKEKAVAVYTLVGENNFWVLIITPDDITPVVSLVKGRELNKKAIEFLGQLSEVDKQTNAPKSSEADVQKSGKELYDIVFAPVAAKLKELKLKPDVLMWSLDGALRYIPAATLYDGKNYMAERYQNVVFTRANSERMLAPVSPIWTGSGFYNSKEQPAINVNGKAVSFDGLKNAKTELETIFGIPPNRGIISGDLLPNEQFTREFLFKALKLHRPLVHIASHFRLQPGDAGSSFLLLGDGDKLTLEDIKNAPDDLFKGVELLTLSACETGVQKERESDGREIDSFAELAQRKGAKAVVASLWKVDDESTSQLMTQFYQTRQTKKLTKVEALQKAQLSLLKSKDFSHPYYWSPFILIGNWR